MTTKISIKNLKTAAFASQETLCFSATVYVDGKAFCTVRNEGTGGPNMFEALPLGKDPLEVAIQALAVRLRPASVATRQEADQQNEAAGMTAERLGWDAWWKAREEGKVVVTHWEAFEDAVDDAVTDAVSSRDLKRSLKNRVLLTCEGERGVFQTKAMTPDALKRALADPALRERLGAEEILNLLPFEKALSIYKERGKG